jgi:acetolactate synthase-1/2/3 large subunit
VPQYVVRSLWEATRGQALVVSDVGQNQMWEAQYYLHDRPRGLISSGGLGTMGFALPAAIGAQLAQPEATVWVTVGDGGFQMNIQELATVVQERLPLKIAILNNGFLGMVRQWQEIFFGRRYSGTPLLGPDFSKVAEAYGIVGLRVSEPGQVAPAIAEAMAQPGPVLIDFRIAQEENVYPMVEPGAALGEMIRRPRFRAEAQAEVGAQEEAGR